MQSALAHVESWIFDLDNSLYPASCDLFALIDIKMGEYIQNLLGCDAVEARRVQKGFFRDHGTTLAGLMKTHGIDPHEFLDFVHDIDLARLSADPAAIAALDRLPGRKFVFTNGDEAYARRVLDRLGPLVVVTASEHRSQHRNRVAARERLAGRLREALAPPPPQRVPTKPSRASQRRRVDSKVRRGRVKSLRGRVRDA